MCAKSICAQSFEYVNPLSRGHVITIQVTPPMVASGDRAVDAKFCRSDQKFVCVISEWFNFAIPLGSTSLPEQWEHNGNNYKMVGVEKITLFEKTRNVILIESVQSGRVYRYIYSYRDGLIAFSSEVDGEHVTFISERAKGFGRVPVKR